MQRIKVSHSVKTFRKTSETSVNDLTTMKKLYIKPQMEIINVESNDFCFNSYAVMDENGNHPGPEQSADYGKIHLDAETASYNPWDPKNW